MIWILIVLLTLFSTGLFLFLFFKLLKWPIDKEPDFDFHKEQHKKYDSRWIKDKGGQTQVKCQV